MDINTNLTYVTCIYDDLFGTEFGGRQHIAWRRYYYGLESATKLNAPIVIFAWPHEVDKVETHFKSFLGENRYNSQIKVIPFDLRESPLYAPIKSIKTYEQGYINDRSYDLMLAKFLFVQHVIDNNYFNSDYIFWMDAGLSHSALFPNKHLSCETGEKRYTECTLFTPAVVAASIKKCNNNLLFIQSNSIGHWMPPDIINLNTRNELNMWYIIGGYFGGQKDKLRIFSKTMIDDFLRYIKENKMLLLDEQVMTIHMSFNKDNYFYETFDVWGHEDSGEWAQPFIQGKKCFHNIFEEFNNI